MDLPEKEFNPADYPPEYVAVGSDETLGSVLERVEDAWTRSPSAVLIIPRGTACFHTTHDFLALGKLQDSRQVRVSIASHDPIIIGLGRVLGFYIVEPVPDHPALAADPVMGSMPEDDIEKPTAPLSIGLSPYSTEWVVAPSQPVYPPSTTTSTWLAGPGEPPARADQQGLPWTAYATPQSPARPGALTPRTSPGQTGQLPSTFLTDTALPTGVIATQPPVDPTPTGSIKARRVVPQGSTYQNRRLKYGGRARPANFGRFFAIFATVLVLALIGGSAYAYVYLPQGTVSITPLNRVMTGLPVEVTVSTGQPVGSDPAPSLAQTSGSGNVYTAPSLTGTLVHTALQDEASRPASGSRQVARGKGQGTMHFTNRTGSPVTVPAGTQFKAPNGVNVQTTQAGTVPATVFGSTFGTLDLPVAAMIEGPDGNIGAGLISGVYGGGQLNYTNTAMQGGGIETIKVVKQEDIDALVAELRAKAEEKAGSAVLGLVGSGQQLITQTIHLDKATFEAVPQAGQDGDSVKVKFGAEAQAYTYNESDMHDSVAQAVLDSVQTSIPRAVGPTLDLGSVQYTPPAVQSVENGRVVYRTEAGGHVSYALT